MKCGISVRIICAVVAVFCNSWVEFWIELYCMHNMKQYANEKMLNVLKRKLAPMLYNLSLIKVKLRKGRLWWLRIWRFTRAVYGVGAHHAVRELTHEINKRCFICLSSRIKMLMVETTYRGCGDGKMRQMVGLGAKIKWQRTWNNTIA